MPVLPCQKLAVSLTGLPAMSRNGWEPLVFGISITVLLTILTPARAGYLEVLPCNGPKRNFSELPDNGAFIIRSHNYFDKEQNYHDLAKCHYEIEVGKAKANINISMTIFAPKMGIACKEMFINCDFMKIVGYPGRHCRGGDFLRFHNGDDIRDQK